MFSRLIHLAYLFIQISNEKFRLGMDNGFL